MHGAAATTLSADHFVVSAQNHDQVGNRAQGERLDELTTPGRRRIAAALLADQPFRPSALPRRRVGGIDNRFSTSPTTRSQSSRGTVTDGRRAEFAAFRMEA